MDLSALAGVGAFLAGMFAASFVRAARARISHTERVRTISSLSDLDGNPEALWLSGFRDGCQAACRVVDSHASLYDHPAAPVNAANPLRRASSFIADLPNTVKLEVK